MRSLMQERGDRTGVQATEAMQKLVTLWQRDDTLEDELLSDALQVIALYEEFQALHTLADANSWRPTTRW